VVSLVRMPSSTFGPFASPLSFLYRRSPPNGPSLGSLCADEYADGQLSGWQLCDWDGGYGYPEHGFGSGDQCEYRVAPVSPGFGAAE